MAWPVEDRRAPAHANAPQPTLLTDHIKTELTEKYLPRYPTKRAALLPALHMLQHEHGWISTQALAEVAEFLGINPAEALDTASFYEEYWLRPKGKYLIQVCRSLSCEICGSKQLTDQIRQKLHLECGQTTTDGKFTLIELECLGSCGTAPAMLINDVLFENVTAESLNQIIDTLPDDPRQFRDPTVDWR